MLDALRRLFTRPAPAARPAALYPESLHVVTTDTAGVACRHPDGQVESIAWDDLDAVVVETNDTGPFGTDVLWLLVGKAGRGGCVVPQGATGERELLDALFRLPGFDSEQFIAAMACTEDRTFVCWRRPPPPV